MAILTNSITNRIILPAGDTGTVVINLTNADGSALTSSVTGTAIFAICRRASNGYVEVARKEGITIVDNSVVVAFQNSDTEGLSPGTYYWDVRVLTDAETGANDHTVETDNVGEVHSLFALTGFPEIEIKGVACNV